MTPEELIEKMAKLWCFGRTKDEACAEMLRVVLKAIEDGEIVEYHDKQYGIHLKPSFSKFLKGE